MKNEFFTAKFSLKSKLIKNNAYNIVFSLLIVTFLVAGIPFNVQAANDSALGVTVSFSGQSSGTTSRSVIDEVRDIIRQNYVIPVSEDVLDAPTIEGIIKGLNDPYSEYFPNENDKNDFINEVNNKMCGIGVTVQGVPEGAKVTSVLEDSPALKVGIQEGDVITSADGNSLAGLAVSEMTSYIKGEEGTTVSLKVKRGEDILSFDITRAEISVPTVTGKIINDKTAYIDIVSFGSDTADLFSKKLKELNAQNPSNYIVDLRDNGGGYMATALEIAGNFIGPKRAIIVEDRDGNQTGYLAEDTGTVIDKPVIFLVNANTASASEILSAAVKDYNKAFFVGTTTYGKGVAQNMFTLSDGSAIKITTERFYSPLGNVIQKKGVTPDFEVKDVNSLAIAELFSGKCMNDVDKSGYLKLTYNGKDFEINLNLAKDENHWAAFKYILSKVNKDTVYIGTKEGWTKAPSDYFNNIYKFLYSDYKNLDALENVSQNRVFTVTFNKEVDASTIKNNTNMEFIDGETGERVDFDVTKVDDKKVSIKPKENLKSGDTYYIKIKDVIKPVIVE
ncbi:PDZ domain-containing protein [Clostridiaceae bacterium UIB06]|uniref:PDZ domain-containing protein n=1 Tax=Clostridium thailandense TaxID=2794346 RepID=A0A949X3P2_9CLOT|nr:S41 family peptidase [Clostridium thailandense]MBV7274999.1 PDZ domain-containing protein [Clostridium thailandense]MCH5137918.1 PDZ domain-containing protein [Clostridiaceae bacterium UIB06]